MATSDEASVQPAMEEASKETPKPMAEAEQQTDTGKDEPTPKPAGEAEAGAAQEKKKDERRACSPAKSLSPEPELGKRLETRAV